MESADRTQVRRQVRQLAQEFLQKNDPTGWFDVVYAQANGNENAVPWANMTPNLLFEDWLNQHNLKGHDKKALVIGCGLGDDAEALARLGFEVTAFDISPKAIAWCHKRFPDSPVHYDVADLFNAPPEWHNQFDFLFECYTLQSLPHEMREQAIHCLAQFIAPQGRILVICLGRNAEDEAVNVPWPLTKEELASFSKAGLKEVAFEDFMDRQNTRRFRVMYGG